MNDDWETPDWLMELINEAYHPTMDPCPLHGSGGLDLKWEGVVYVNPPYSNIDPWVEKALRSKCKVIMLLPVRTDRPWWDIVKHWKIFWLPRLCFKGAKHNSRECNCLAVKE